MNETETLAFAERFIGAIQTGDVETVRASYAPDARIWHNTDGVEQTVDQNMKVLGWFMRKLPARHYRITRREALKDGFLQQHVLEATLPDGTAQTLPACVIITMKDGLIVRLDEYLDSATADLMTVAVTSGARP